MRIISGSHKGRRIIVPKKLPVRPTTDQSKEALFNILSNRIEWDTVRVLDLFSGTGNMSYEFCSRGVNQITAVDQNKYCARFISQTNTLFDFNINVVCKNAFLFLKEPHIHFDIIFADPPFDLPQSEIEKLINLIFENKWLKKDGELILKHFKKIKFNNYPNFINSRNYGSSTFSFFS